MPTANCDDCGKDVSVHAAQCPHCGSPAEHALKSSRRKEEETEQAEKSNKAKEEVLFSSNEIVVTRTRFITPDQTYLIRNITSVKYIESIPGPHYVAAILYVIFGLTIPGYWGFLFFSGTSSLEVISWGFPIRMLIILLSVLVIGVVGYYLFKWMLREVYEIILVTTAGEVSALKSKDEQFTNEIFSALNKAISQH